MVYDYRFCVGDRFYLCDNKILCEYDYEERLVFANMAYNPSTLAQLKRQTNSLPVSPSPFIVALLSDYFNNPNSLLMYVYLIVVFSVLNNIFLTHYTYSSNSTNISVGKWQMIYVFLHCVLIFCFQTV